ncbi:MAG TPA: hypothetical protein VD997_05895 [Phycisphaerales bacterium]|nr:hypothetical protein [Phycisphaerales bacterium]
MSAPSKTRLAWLDRYKAPTPDDLLAPFNKQSAALIEHTRQKLRACEGVKEDIAWHGVWNWAFVYRMSGDAERAWAYLIPDPAKPRVVLPVLDDALPELPIRKLTKFIRDGLTHAPMVDGLRWASWDLLNKTQADDIVSLAQMRPRMAGSER